MVAQLVECVPNISEGRDIETINAIVDVVRATPGCTVLGVEPDHDYNRTVITFAGEPSAVKEGAKALIGESISKLDMRTHSGEHPRMGVVDVCPFVPLSGISMGECAQLARDVVSELAETHPVPFYLYGEASTSGGRKLLSTLRKGQYEGLEARYSGGDSPHNDETRWPDLGPREWSTTVAKSGAITVGARPILVAYNVNVNETDAFVSKMIGSIVRSSGRLLKSEQGGKIRSHGMLNHVQGMGVPLEEMGISQVSMNLLDVSECPLHLAYRTCQSLASDHGIDLCGSEIVGLVPLAAMLDAGRYFAPDAEDHVALVDAAVIGLGLNEHHSFEPMKHIIEWALASEVVE